MKIKCGTDIVEIERIKNSIEKLGNKFLDRIYTEEEKKYCESKGNQKYQHFAARFAVKEAAFKAISEQLDDKYSVCWKDFEVVNDSAGKPNINILGINTKQIASIDVSISHCKDYATANVVVLYK